MDRAAPREVPEAQLVQPALLVPDPARRKRVGERGGQGRDHAIAEEIRSLGDRPAVDGRRRGREAKVEESQSSV